MTSSGALRAAAGTILVGLLAAAAVFAAVFLYLQTRPAQFEARIALLAVPASSSAGADFGTVVSLTLPSVAEVARSTSVLTATAAAVPGAPSVDALAGKVAVELVPGSGVARLTVTGSSGEQASRLAQALGQQIVAADLLAPAGDFRQIDRTAPQARQTAPDRHLALGLAAAAALVAGSMAAVASLLLNQRVVSRRQAVRAIDDPSVPVLEQRRADHVTALRELTRHASAVTVLAAGRAAVQPARALERALQPELVPAGPAAGESPTTTALVLVAAVGRTSLDDVRLALSLARAGGRPVLALVLA